MKSKWYSRVSTLALAAVVSSMAAATSWGEAGDNGQFFMIEGMWLSQDDGDTIPFTAPTGNIGPATPFALVTTDDLDLDDVGGARVTVQFSSWGGDCTWQVSAFAVSSFESDFSITGLDPTVGDTSTTYAKFIGGTDTSSGAPENSDEFHQMDLNLEANLWGAEASWVRNLTDYGWHRTDLLIGVRYIHYGEELKSTVFDEPGDLTGGNGIDDLNIEVDNDLVGLQIGLQTRWNISPTVSIGGTLKGGIAANFLNRDRSFRDRDGDLGNLIYSDNADDTGFAQFAEFNPRIEVVLGDSATLTVGGTVLWINDTTRAASHYQSAANTADSALRDDEDQLFYGASIGLRLALN